MVDSDNLAEIKQADALNWSDIEPSVFGTLFERILNVETRSKLGAHYTSKADIEQVVRPVLMSPLEAEWEAVSGNIYTAAALGGNLDAATIAEIRAKLSAFLERLAATTVLDPACGSGNFLYISLAMLKELERKVVGLASEFSIFDLPPAVHPRQLHGIETNPYAHELASIVVWIGYLQWKHRNGAPLTDELPVLQPLDTIQLRDAILDLTNPAQPKEPDWPTADVIVGNPPFLGGKLLRTNLGDEYVDSLFTLYEGRVSAEADLVCYWFEKARAMVATKRVKRAGLLATQGIRGGPNRRVLESIKQTGDIFLAYSDRPWVLDGAAVHVSIVGFDDGTEQHRMLDGQTVAVINSNLTAGLDMTKSRRLKENLGVAFMGDTKGGPFDISESLALEMMKAHNPHGKSNVEVIRPWVNGLDITQRPGRMWIIDFGPDMSLEQAALYEAPFEYVRAHVKPERLRMDDKGRFLVKREAYRSRWWIHMEPRSEMREAFSGLQRYIGTPLTAKHRFFVWLAPGVLPANGVIVFARDDDYTFGVLQSRIHELWARAKGTQLREAESGGRYTLTTTFETFPLPWPLGQESKDDPRAQAITEEAHKLNELRDNWLDPPGAPDEELKQRTLTNLYNLRPTWLANAHARLDFAVLAAYGWPPDLDNATLLANLLALNLEREPA
jgi:type II restriction/modification system DNA methylase subunit YeeA